MNAAELVCVNCRNWESEKCNGCVFYDMFPTYEPLLIEFLHYEHTFLTPEQWEQRTGEKWIGAVWILVKGEDCSGYGVGLYSDAERIHCPDGEVLICNGPEVPGDD
jgi:hypothetical protein